MQITPQFGSRPPTPKRGRSLTQESGTGSRVSSKSTLSGYSDNEELSNTRERSPSVDRVIRHEARRVMKEFGATVQAVVERVNTKRPNKPSIDLSYATSVINRQAEALSKLTSVSNFHLGSDPQASEFYGSVRSGSLASWKRKREGSSDGVSLKRQISNLGLEESHELQPTQPDTTSAASTSFKKCRKHKKPKTKFRDDVMICSDTENELNDTNHVGHKKAKSRLSTAKINHKSGGSTAYKNKQAIAEGKGYTSRTDKQNKQAIAEGKGYTSYADKRNKQAIAEGYTSYADKQNKG